MSTPTAAPPQQTPPPTPRTKARWWNLRHQRESSIERSNNYSKKRYIGTMIVAGVAFGFAFWAVWPAHAWHVAHPAMHVFSWIFLVVAFLTGVIGVIGVAASKYGAHRASALNTSIVFSLLALLLTGIAWFFTPAAYDLADRAPSPGSLLSPTSAPATPSAAAPTPTTTPRTPATTPPAAASSGQGGSTGSGSSSSSAVATNGTYTVKSGDTLGKIAKANGTTVAALVKLNPQYAKNPNMIHKGDVVKVSAHTHTVKSGDTLGKIAKANGTTVAKLLVLNPSLKSHPNVIHVGNVIVLP